MNGEGPDDPKVPEAKGEPEAEDEVEDTRTPSQRAEAQSRAADEWSNRHQKSIDEMQQRAVARLDAEQEAERQRQLAGLEVQAQELLDRVQSSVTKPVLDEEQANDKRKLAQLEIELKQVRAMRRKEETAEMAARRATRDTFRKLVNERYGKASVQQVRPVQTGDPTAQDMFDYMLLVDDIRVEQGLAPKYADSIDETESDLPTKQEVVDKHQAMRDAAADNI
jgi:hypothetical protein